LCRNLAVVRYFSNVKHDIISVPTIVAGQ